MELLRKKLMPLSIFAKKTRCLISCLNMPPFAKVCENVTFKQIIQIFASICQFIFFFKIVVLRAAYDSKPISNFSHLVYSF